MTTAPLTLLALAAAALGAGCATTGDFVWADELPPLVASPVSDYVIRPGDRLDVRVYGQEAISGLVRVREDGRLSLPMMPDQVAAGLRPEDLAELLRATLQTFIRNPVVTVAFEARRAPRVTVIGKVTAPGVFETGPGRGVLDAVAQAGGLTRGADDDRIFVVRPGAEDRQAARIRFRYRELLAAEPHSAAFELQDGDTVVVQ